MPATIPITTLRSRTAGSARSIVVVGSLSLELSEMIVVTNVVVDPMASETRSLRVVGPRSVMLVTLTAVL